MKKIKSDRKKYNPGGLNEYTAPKERPPRRYDTGKRHQYDEDPLDKDDNHEEKEMNRRSTEDIVKKLAKSRLKKAARKEYGDTGYNQAREGLENFKFKEKGIKQLAKTYKFLADSFMSLAKANNTFSSCKSSEISPDGKLGGKGYVQPIKNIRMSLAECMSIMSEALDTFHDEVNSPYWKKKTIEDHPAVKEILDDADDLLDKAEELEEQAPDANMASPENLVLSDDEKSKIKNILKVKGY